MRGPLGNIHTSLETLKKKLGEHCDQSVQDMIAVASRSEQQVRRMLDSLLDLQRLEEGSKLLDRTTTALAAIITSAVEQAKPCADDKAVQLDFVMPEDLPLLYIDADTIERVIINLLDNAIKYSPDGSSVTISTTAIGSEVHIRVKDSGPGIPGEAQATIFDKFSRVKQQNMPSGIGLGLAFCKLAVEGHGGRIWVKNNDEGGSTFTFALPVEAPSTKELPLLHSPAS
jgi:K+-sensing histidine kinase KdpD